MDPMITPTLLVLAAGMGSRYGGLKQVDPIGPDNETIMDYSIFDARRAGFGKVVFVIRKEMEQTFKKIIGARYEKRVAVEYVFQELGKLTGGFRLPPERVKPWGTTHAVLMTSSAIHEPFAVINSDDFYGVGSFRALAHHLQSDISDYALVGYTLRDTLSDFGSVARAVCQVDTNGFLQDICELKGIEREGGHAVNTDSEGHETRLTGSEIVSMNMWGFTPQVFDQLRESFQQFLKQNGEDLNAECYLPTTLNQLVHVGKARVKVLPSADSWFGITYREDRDHAIQNIHRLIESGAYPKRLWS
jgi:NDP-sugar pyrophosphorylase family protein